MSDEESVHSSEHSDSNEETGDVEVSNDTPKGQMPITDALKGALKIALIHDGLVRGLRECCKALDREEAHICILNDGCDEDAYKKLVCALCKENNIPLMKVSDGVQLGEMAGLCQVDREGNTKKVVKCSCVVVRGWGEESIERSVIMDYLKNRSTVG